MATAPLSLRRHPIPRLCLGCLSRFGFAPSCRPRLPPSAHWCVCATTAVSYTLGPFGVCWPKPASSLPDLPLFTPLSCETFRLEPATRRFVWSFAPMPISCQRVEHQHGSGPPAAFPRPSTSTSIVHRLSGPTHTTPVSTSASIHLAVCVVSLVRVSIRGGHVRLLLLYFHSSRAKCPLFTFRSRYFFSIGLSPYLAFGAHATTSHCTTKQHYSSRLGSSGAITRLGTAFHQFLPFPMQRLPAYHPSSSLFGRPYYGNPCLFLLLPLVICLSPGCPPAHCASFGPHHYAVLFAFPAPVIA